MPLRMGSPLKYNKHKNGQKSKKYVRGYLFVDLRVKIDKYIVDDEYV